MTEPKRTPVGCSNYLLQNLPNGTNTKTPDPTRTEK